MSSITKNFRRRAGDSNNEDDTPNDSVTTSTTRPKSSTTTTKPKKPTTHPNQAPKKLLSFVEDDDEENGYDSSPISRPHPKPKPQSSSRLNNKTSLAPSSSHKHSSSKDRPPPPPSNVLPQSGQYSSEALLELRKNHKTVGTSSSSHRPSPSEPVIVLKGLVKPIAETLKEVDELEHEEEREEATTAQLASIGLGGKSIPDQQMINAIRAKRERLRQSRAAAPDFIALDGGSNHGEAEGLSDEEPEFRGRIGFFGEKKKGVFDGDDVGEKVAIEDVGFGKGGGEVFDEEEEEDKIWEEEQFRKGLGKRMEESSASGRLVGTSSSVPLPVVVQSIPQQAYTYSPAVASYSSVPSIGGAVGALPGLEVMSLPQQAEVAKKALHENLRRLKVYLLIQLLELLLLAMLWF